MALGRGIVSPAFFQPSVNSFTSIAFIGLPCPTNKTGMRSVVLNFSVILSKSLGVIIAPAVVIAANACKNFLRSIGYKVLAERR
jgi:hypothetical protein